MIKVKTFKIPVSWELYGYVEIEADSIEEAINIFDAEIDDWDLPSNSSYVDGSFNRESEDFCKEYNS